MFNFVRDYFVFLILSSYAVDQKRLRMWKLEMFSQKAGSLAVAGEMERTALSDGKKYERIIVSDGRLQVLLASA